MRAFVALALLFKNVASELDVLAVRENLLNKLRTTMINKLTEKEAKLQQVVH